MLDDLDDNFPNGVADDVRAELSDPMYSTRQHYSRATYALGCHGPLCRLRETHRGRQRNQERTEAKGKKYVPLLDIRKTDREEELAPIIAWHLHSRKAKMSSEQLTR